MKDSYKELVKNLNNFIKRYYYNLLIKGALLFLSGFAGLAIIIALLEFVGYFNSTSRLILLLLFVVFNGYLFIRYIFIPLLSLLRIGKSISLEEAAVLVGKFFRNEINDKITNTLQLKNYVESKSYNFELLNASIQQKSKALVSVPFYKAVDFNENRKYVWISLGIVFVFVVGWNIVPFLFKDPIHRVVKFDTKFERPAPFQIQILNELPLSGYKNENYKLQIQVDGSVFPSQVQVVYKGKKPQMQTKERNKFEYVFSYPDSDIEFYLSANGFQFGPYLLNIEGKAIFRNFVLEVEYPGYTRLEDEEFVNMGDLRLPVGTVLNWKFVTENSHAIKFQIDQYDTIIKPQRGQNFSWNRVLESSFDYQISSLDSSFKAGDSLSYSIEVIPDLYPSISVQEYRDSLMRSYIFFQGLISDDYGFSNLNFQYLVLDEKEFDNVNLNDQKFSVVDIDFERYVLQQNFYYTLDVNELNISPGQQIAYYFEVADNDGILGPKSSQTPIYVYSIPNFEELIAENLANSQKIEEQLSESVHSAEDIQKEIDELRRDMLHNDNITWEQRESLQNLLDKQKRVQEQFEEFKNISEHQNHKNNEFREENEDIRRKQEELQKLFDEVLTEEMKDLYNKIQEELEKLNREEMFEYMDQLEFEMKDLSHRLDRALELFKQLQVERMLQESIDALERLQEEQVSLHEDLMQDGISDDMKNDQESINESYDFIKDLLDQMHDKNNELNRPNDFSDTSQEQENIQNALDSAMDALEKNNFDNSGQNQQNAINSMEELSQALKGMQAQMKQDNLAEDIRTLREILDNLLKTSFNQEDLMEEFRVINVRDPKYFQKIQDQRKIRDDISLIQDSLTALAKRQIQIQSYVNREIEEINLNIDHAMNDLVNRRKHSGISRQQFVMTHVNNLALLLNESMQNMQSQMQQAMGEGQGQEGGEGGPGFGDLREMQEQMNKMLEQLQQGHQPMPGQSGSEGMGLSEQLARMAAEQEAIRNALNELASERRGEGEGTGELEELMKEMERTELDIVTNNINRRTQFRQQEILTRLLEHENAERERELEERREGNTAKFYELSNPENFFEYNRIKNRDIEMLRSVPPSLRPHYKSIVEKYFLNVE